MPQESITGQLEDYNFFVTVPLQKAILLGKATKPMKVKAKIVQDFQGWWKISWPLEELSCLWTYIHVCFHIAFLPQNLQIHPSPWTSEDGSIHLCLRPSISSMRFVTDVLMSCTHLGLMQLWRSLKNDSWEMRVKYNFLSLHRFPLSVCTVLSLLMELTSLHNWVSSSSSHITREKLTAAI